MRIIGESRGLGVAGGVGAAAATLAACAAVDMNEVAIPSPADALDAVTTFKVISQGGEEANPVVRAISDGTPLQDAAGGLLLKIAARAVLTGITGSEDCARAVTNSGSVLGAVNNALSLAGVAHPVSGVIGGVTAFAVYALYPADCRLAPPPNRQRRHPDTDDRG